MVIADESFMNYEIQELQQINYVLLHNLNYYNSNTYIAG